MSSGSRVTFSSSKRSSDSPPRSSPRSSPGNRRKKNHGITLHGGYGNHRKPKVILREEDFYEERIWDVQRTKREFIQQSLFMPNYNETLSLLNDIHDNLLHEPGHLNYDDYCEFCKEALKTSGLAPKQQEMKELFRLIDEDRSNSLERHEILHAVMANWEVKRLLANSKTLQPLSSVGAWKRAFEKLKQPNRRLGASKVLLRISSDETCARAICEWKNVHDTSGSRRQSHTTSTMNKDADIPMLAALAPLLTIGKGQTIAINVAGIFGNLAWHVPSVKLHVPDRYFNYFWVSSGDHIKYNEKLKGGLIHLLIEGGKDRIQGSDDSGGGGRLNDQELSVVMDSIHNYCYGIDDGGKRNKSEILHHYYRPLKLILLTLSSSSQSLTVRRSANTLICLLNLRKDDEDGGDDDGGEKKE
jgi:hypothetical protein